MSVVAIVGAKGFVGSALSKELEKEGVQVVSIDREDTSDRERFKSKLEGSDVVVNLAGAPIIGRWSEEYKKLLYSSRIDTTNTLVELLNGLDKKPSLFISTSAVGIYKDGEGWSEEDEPNSDDYLGKICRDWERAALNAEGVARTVVFRFGVIIGKGGMMNKVLPPFRLGLGGIIGDGKQGFSWVSLEDVVGAIIFAIKGSCQGVYNLSAPNPTDNYGFTKALGRVLNRPTVLPLPAFVLRLIYGEGSTVLLNGQKVLPKRLLQEGFSFRHEHIEDALKSATN